MNIQETSDGVSALELIDEVILKRQKRHHSSIPPAPPFKGRADSFQ